MAKKQQLGQFFTENSEYILKNLSKYVRGKNVTDPFAGSGNLLDWAEKHGAKSVRGFDVDKKLLSKRIKLNDSLNNPLRYDFVVTNPPYLNINKADKMTKSLYFNNSEHEDLYQISLKSMSDSEEGIIIVPINFLSAANSKKIREQFFSKFLIDEMNYFRNQVFSDTTYNVIAFHYKRRKVANSILDKEFVIKTHIYPDNLAVSIKINRDYDWAIGGEISKKISRVNNFLGLRRLTEKDLSLEKGNIKITAAYNHIDTRITPSVSKNLYDKVGANIILLKAIDSGSQEGKIALEDIREYGVKCLVSKETSRHMIYLLFENYQLSVEDQVKIIDLFNKEIERMRKEYLSLFLTNYRDNDRKRISFDFVYKFINYLYSTRVKNEQETRLFVQKYESVG